MEWGSFRTIAGRMADLSASRGSSARNWGVTRFLAPLALIAVLVAVFVVVNGSLGEEGSSTAGDVEATTGVNGGGDGVEGDGAENPKTYTVESGDVLSSIAEQFGVSVDRLERLNPDVDPQTLNAGVEIKIR